MTAAGCDRLGLAELTDYAAGELSEAEAAAVEAHVFACAECGARAAELDAIAGAVAPAVRSADVGGNVTDADLNRLAREGVRVRSYSLSPGAIVPCAVWEDDELMVLRLRGDFADATQFTLVQRATGTDLVRVTGHLAPGTHGEVIYTMPAASIRHLPVVDVEILLTTAGDGQERAIGSYTLVHGGSLQR